MGIFIARVYSNKSRLTESKKKLSTPPGVRPPQIKVVGRVVRNFQSRRGFEKSRGHRPPSAEHSRPVPQSGERWIY